MTVDEKRDELRSRIEEAEARNAERSIADYARNARDETVSFVKRHPVAAVTGALALGAVLALAVPRRGRKFSLSMGRKIGVLGTLAAEIGLNYGLNMLDAGASAARSGKNRIEEFGDTMASNARSLGRTAGERASGANDAVKTLRKSLTRKAGGALRDLRSRTH